MKLFRPTPISVAVIVALGLGTAAPAAATPAFVPKAPSISSPVVEVHDRRFQYRGDFGGYGRHPGREVTPDWRGHRGYHHARPGYRYHDGWWFPPAAFALGAIISGGMAPPVFSGGSRHVDWCYDRYRSYRHWDNTFQPYYGSRRQCISPFS